MEMGISIGLVAIVVGLYAINLQLGRIAAAVERANQTGGDE